MIRTIGVVTCLGLALLGAGCSSAPKQKLDVTVDVSVCVHEHATCFALGVPGAGVVIAGDDGRRLGRLTTDDDGHATLSTGYTGDVTVTATSALIANGTATTRTQLIENSSTPCSLTPPAAADITAATAG